MGRDNHSKASKTSNSTVKPNHTNAINHQDPKFPSSNVAPQVLSSRMTLPKATSYIQLDFLCLIKFLLAEIILIFNIFSIFGGETSWIWRYFIAFSIAICKDSIFDVVPKEYFLLNDVDGVRTHHTAIRTLQKYFIRLIFNCVLIVSLWQSNMNFHRVLNMFLLVLFFNMEIIIGIAFNYIDVLKLLAISSPTTGNASSGFPSLIYLSYLIGMPCFIITKYLYYLYGGLYLMSCQILSDSASSTTSSTSTSFPVILYFHLPETILMFYISIFLFLSIVGLLYYQKHGINILFHLRHFIPLKKKPSSNEHTKSLFHSLLLLPFLSKMIQWIEWDMHSSSYGRQKGSLLPTSHSQKLFCLACLGSVVNGLLIGWFIVSKRALLQLSIILIMTFLTACMFMITTIYSLTTGETKRTLLASSSTTTTTNATPPFVTMNKKTIQQSHQMLREHQQLLLETIEKTNGIHTTNDDNNNNDDFVNLTKSTTTWLRYKGTRLFVDSPIFATLLTTTPANPTDNTIKSSIAVVGSTVRRGGGVRRKSR